MGAQPLTFLDYIANDKLNPTIIKEIVEGMASACRENNIALVGGETAEMPDTYLSGEHDLVGIITGIIDKKNIIDGSKIRKGDIVLGLPSTGLQTNGYSLARKLFFEVGQYKVSDILPSLNNSIGETLLEPSYIYNNYIQLLLQHKIQVNGMAHISGGGLVENIPRILPSDCTVEIKKDSWPILPIFNVMQDIGNINDIEMYRTFNMGIGMILIISAEQKQNIISTLKGKIAIYEIGKVLKGSPKVSFI
jgi:phosphoribosylformylglycinamidine cyclo-ligase